MQELDGAGMLASESNPQPVLPSADSVKKLHFLDAVIHESLRCFPPAVFGGSRLLDRDVDLDGFIVPKGTTINMNIWSLHYSAAAWGADAGLWRPDRWLEGRSCNAVKRDANGHLRWVPFTQGAQNCIGQHLATVRFTSLLALRMQALCIQRAQRTAHIAHSSLMLLVLFACGP